MRKPFLLVVGGLCLVFFTISGNKEPHFKGETTINKKAPKPATLKVDADYGKMPLYFIPNQGQMDKQVAYYVQGKDKTLYFTEEGITFALTKPASREKLPSASVRKYCLGLTWLREPEIS